MDGISIRIDGRLGDGSEARRVTLGSAPTSMCLGLAAAFFDFLETYCELRGERLEFSGLALTEGSAVIGTPSASIAAKRLASEARRDIADPDYQPRHGEKRRLTATREGIRRLAEAGLAADMVVGGQSVALEAPANEEPPVVRGTLRRRVRILSLNAAPKGKATFEVVVGRPMRFSLSLSEKQVCELGHLMGAQEVEVSAIVDWRGSKVDGGVLRTAEAVRDGDWLEGMRAIGAERLSRHGDASPILELVRDS